MSAKTKTRRPKRVRRALPESALPTRPPSSLGLLTLQEVADELRIAKSSVSAMVASGALKGIRPIPGGKCLRVFRSDLVAYIEGLRK